VPTAAVPTPDLAGFRADARRWLEEHCPDSMRTPITSAADVVFGGRRATFPDDDARRWLELMAGRGWTAPTWPVEYGGAGLSRPEARALAAEMRSLGCRQPVASVHGIGMLGPTMIQYATDEQCRRFLPATAAGRIRWCQGFSEPGSGSDLASVRTRATRDGDEYVVSGQKIWTTYAHDCDWIFLVARTDPDAPKRAGLSFFLVDLETPGITVRPITLISGVSEFCEVFFDDVRVPAGNRIGDDGAGWSITKTVLSHERRLAGEDAGLGTNRHDGREFVRLARHLLDRPTGPLPDDVLRAAIARVDIEQECCRAALRRAAAPAGTGGSDGGLHPSMVKLALSTLLKRQADLSCRLAGYAGLGWAGETFSAGELELTRDYLFTKAWTIAGGSSEIQLNIIARRILGLPHLGPEVE
jgi:acyl-CoA dehydrogenase